jgi:SAM-dependent methyltransferase
VTNPLHEANRLRWEAAAPGWERMVSKRAWRIAHTEPDKVLHPRERARLVEPAGRRACVLGSGDNHVVFALAGLGARVTSVDISAAQLQTARSRAEQNGLEIEFVEADVTDLSALSSESFDIVYTGGHVAVWVSDLDRFYAEAARILVPDGQLLIHEYHPIRHVWADQEDRLEVEYSYFDKTPHEYAVSEELFDRTPGELVQYEFQWTVADFFHAVTRAGCQILELDEFGDAPQGWERAPLRGLPASLLIDARKTRAKEDG